jgi:hypothetical protein
MRHITTCTGQGVETGDLIKIYPIFKYFSRNENVHLKNLILKNQRKET